MSARNTREFEGACPGRATASDSAQSTGRPSLAPSPGVQQPVQATAYATQEGRVS